MGMYLEATNDQIEVWGVGHAIIYYVSQTITITIQLNHGLQKTAQILIILGVFHSTGATPICKVPRTQNFLFTIRVRSMTEGNIFILFVCPRGASPGLWSFPMGGTPSHTYR